MKRAGLDYHDYATMKVHKHWDAFVADCAPDDPRLPRRRWVHGIARRC